jgi:hypothetical protein
MIPSSAIEREQAKMGENAIVKATVLALFANADTILDDVNYWLRDKGPAGKIVTDDEELERFEAIRDLLTKDSAALAEDSNYGFPYRTALYTIGWRNGVQSGTYMIVSDLIKTAAFGEGQNEGIDSFIRSWMGESFAPDSLKKTQGTAPGTTNESRLRRRLKEGGEGIVLHTSAEVLKILASKVGVEIAPEVVETALKLGAIRDIAAAAVDPTKWKAILDLGEAGGTDRVWGLLKRQGQNVEVKGAKRIWTEYIAEPAMSIYQGLDLQKVAQIIGSLKQNIKQANALTAVNEADIMEEGRKVIASITKNNLPPTPDRILNLFLSGAESSSAAAIQTSKMGTPIPLQGLEKLRALANSGRAKLGSGATTGASSEEMAALRFFIELSSDNSRLAQAVASRLPLNRGLSIGKSLAIVLGSALSALGSAIEAVDLSFIDYDINPESFDGTEIVTLLGDGKIRREAGDAQQYIYDNVSGLSKDADKALLTLLRRAPFSQVNATDIAAALDAVNAVPGLPTP